MHQLSFPLSTFREDLRELLRAQNGSIMYRPAGLRWEGEELVEVCRAGVPTPGGSIIGLRLIEHFGEAPDASGVASDCSALLEVGCGSSTGRARGWLRGNDGVWKAAGRLKLPGAGFSVIPLDASATDRMIPRESAERHSRTIGYLGMDAYTR